MFVMIPSPSLAPFIDYFEKRTFQILVEDTPLMDEGEELKQELSGGAQLPAH